VIGTESEVGRGSTFHFTVAFDLPVAPVKLANSSLSTLQGLHALIVDDNLTNRTILQVLLASWQMKPTAVASGQEALTCLRQAEEMGTPFRLILVDGNMPEMDGFALAERVKEFPGLGDVTILMLTSDSQTNALQRCREVGIAAHLLKPISQSELLGSILRLGNMAAVPYELEVPPATIISDAPLLHILLAEDNLVNQRLAVRLLEKRGHAVTVAKDGLEALRASADKHFDLILMDLQMPEMGGMEVTAAIRARELSTGAHTPIIAMTAHAMTGDRERCIQGGMDGYLSKPITAALLYKTVEDFATPALTLEDAKITSLEAAEITDQKQNQGPPVEPVNMEAVDGDEDLFIEIATLFLEEQQQMLTAIQAAISIGDGPALSRAAHSLKGVAANFRAQGVVAMSEELENIGSSGDLDQSHEVYARLEREMSRLTASLRAFVNGKVLCLA